MKPLSSLILFASVALAACGGTPTTVATSAPAPAATPSRPAPAVTAPSTNVPRVTLAESPRNWHLLDESSDRIPGIAADRAMKELLVGKTPRRTVVVAIIDSGIDTAHVDLKANLWTNPKETAGNKRDDDNNGYTDDVRGWNFIGGTDGKNVDFDTFEITREYARCHGKAAAGGVAPIADAALCTRIDADFQAKRTEIEKTVGSYREVAQVYTQIIPLLKRAASTDSLTGARVRAINTTDPMLGRARQIYLQLDSQGASPQVIEDGLKSLEGQLKHGLNPDYSPRSIVGDTYSNPAERRYGNSDVTGPDAKHGTHVAGIIGALRGNSVGTDGIAPDVRLMSIRTVPDGDERDKDVANAIRYAADAGANIISMSFGKSQSPFKSAVDDAVKYADSKGVLLVHAAGNDGADLAKGKNFPTPTYTGGGRAANWIEVGASSWKGGDSLAAPFSNYGKEQVDVFAPGVDIYSTIPGNKYEKDSGTSMAAPVVSGLAALIMSYYPNLSASDVRKIIVSSVAKHGDQMVIKPGTENEKVPFGTLSVTGGIVNAYNAVKMADEMSRVRP